jgi:hypothetical protein
MYDNAQNKERAIVSVRFSEHMQELIEFDVELAPVPIDDMKGKDVTVNFLMSNGFDPKGTYWTDSNGLEMQKREIVNYNVSNPQFTKSSMDYKNISRNYYPVSSAIAMRDSQANSNIQVTILNDRPQGGSADLSAKSTIELMQHRRLIRDDEYGLDNYLNEIDNDGNGI